MMEKIWDINGILIINANNCTIYLNTLVFANFTDKIPLCGMLLMPSNKKLMKLYICTMIK